jgi:hypothetical protein
VPSQGLSGLMSSPFHKRMLFRLIRRVIELRQYDVCIIGTDAWVFEGNEKYTALSREEQHKLSSPAFAKAVAGGYGEVKEAIQVYGSTPTQAHIVALEYVGDKVISVTSGRVDAPGGTMKMWGEWNEPGMKESYKRAWALPDPVLALQVYGVDFDRLEVIR